VHCVIITSATPPTAHFTQGRASTHLSTAVPFLSTSSRPRLTHQPASTLPLAAGKNAVADYQAARIPGSQFFDIDGVADLSIALPHMVPSEHAFAAAMDALGISNDTFVVLYDRVGIFSAPRAWWTFRIFGHSRCCSTHILACWPISWTLPELSCTLYLQQRGGVAKQPWATSRHHGCGTASCVHATSVRNVPAWAV
jgi:hypothetical protein